MGFSICLHSDHDHAEMPRPTSWTAPEWHHRGHSFHQIVKMEIYSFGMLCFWLLLDQDVSTKVISCDSCGQQLCWHLEDLKNTNKLIVIATELVHKSTEFSNNQKQCLALLLNSCLVSNPDTRESSMDRVFRNLSTGSTMTAKATFPSDDENGDPRPWRLFSVI